MRRARHVGIKRIAEKDWKHEELWMKPLTSLVTVRILGN